MVIAPRIRIAPATRRPALVKPLRLLRSAGRQQDTTRRRCDKPTGDIDKNVLNCVQLLSYDTRKSYRNHSIKI